MGPRLRLRSPIVLRWPLFWAVYRRREWVPIALPLQPSLSGLGWSIKLWRVYIEAALGGISVYAFRRRLLMKPIDYTKTFLVEGEGRTARLPKIHNLDLRSTVASKLKEEAK